MFIFFILAFTALFSPLSTIDQIQVIIWFSLYLLTNFIIGFHPFSFKWNIIRLISVLMIFYITIRNLDQSIYFLSLLMPVSQDKIDFVHDFEVKSMNFYKNKSSVFYLKNLTLDITNFINNLNEDDNYWVSLSFYPDISGYNMEDGLKLYISDPILINKDSSPFLLTQFILHRLNVMIDFYYLDDSIINSEDPVIIVKFTEIELN